LMTSGGAYDVSVPSHGWISQRPRPQRRAGPGVHFVSSGLLQLTVLRIAEGLMSRLQPVQNAAARLVSGARRYDHIMPVLQELHWLPVRRRVDFKMATLVYLSLSGMAPAYLAADCQLVSARRSPSAAFCHIEDVRCEGEPIQQLRRLVFCSCRSEAVEQPSK